MWIHGGWESIWTQAKKQVHVLDAWSRGLCPTAVFTGSHSPARSRLCPRRYFILFYPGRQVGPAAPSARPHIPANPVITPLHHSIVPCEFCHLKGTRAQLKSVQTNCCIFLRWTRLGSWARNWAKVSALTSARGEDKQIPPLSKTVLCLGRPRISLHSKLPFSLFLPTHTSCPCSHFA